MTPEQQVARVEALVAEWEEAPFCACGSPVCDGMDRTIKGVARRLRVALLPDGHTKLLCSFALGRGRYCIRPAGHGDEHAPAKDK